jgi:hypothetical protein
VVKSLIRVEGHVVRIVGKLEGEIPLRRQVYIGDNIKMNLKK